MSRAAERRKRNRNRRLARDSASRRERKLHALTLEWAAEIRRRVRQLGEQSGASFLSEVERSLEPLRPEAAVECCLDDLRTILRQAVTSSWTGGRLVSDYARIQRDELREIREHRFRTVRNG